MARPYDIVLFGATGFTGGLTAEYLARQPHGSWALAGRNQGKLEGVRERLTAIDPACAELPLLRADVDDHKSMREIAEAARVVINTVGPFLKYGEPLVAACAEAGTGYLDLSGEPEFIDRMYVRHHATAVQSGARLLHACGFESIVPDLGVYFTLKQLPADKPVRIEGFVRTSASISGGSFGSFLGAVSRPRAAAEAARARREAEGRPEGRRVSVRPGRPRRAYGMWALPAPTSDPQIVAISARSLDSYGPDFTYRHHAALRRLSTAIGLAAGVGALTAAAQIPPLRRRLASLRGPGEGPDEDRRAKSWFRLRFLGKSDGEQVITEVAGGDPGYDETAKILGETALCLAFDDLPETAGQVTTAIAMADALLERLTRAGITFRVISR